MIQQFNVEPSRSDRIGLPADLNRTQKQPGFLIYKIYVQHSFILFSNHIECCLSPDDTLRLEKCQI